MATTKKTSGVYSIKPRKRYGVTIDDDGKQRVSFWTVTGEWADGTKCWMECDKDSNVIDHDSQYILYTRGGWSEFVKQ